MKKLDLTEKKFEIINFEEATIIDLFFPMSPVNILEFDVWGARLLLDPYWKSEDLFNINIPHGKDLYLYGKGHVRIEGIVGGEIEIYPYDQINRLPLKNPDNSNVIFKHKWPRVDYTQCYFFESGLLWPDAWINLNLYCQGGSVTMMFDKDNLIPEDWYLNDPQMYVIRNNMDKILNSPAIPKN